MSGIYKSTPLVVGVLGVLALLFGFLMIFVGIIYSLALIAMPGDMPSWVSASTFLVVGAVHFLIGCGFLKGWTVFWYIGVVVNVLSIISSLLAMPAGIFSFIISIIVLWYLFRPSVKGYFLDD